MPKKEYNRNTFFIEIGGFLWWFFIRFGKTDLKYEQSEKYNARNVIFIFIFIMIVSFIKIKLFDN